MISYKSIPKENLKIAETKLKNFILNLEDGSSFYAFGRKIRGLKISDDFTLYDLGDNIFCIRYYTKVTSITIYQIFRIENPEFNYSSSFISNYFPGAFENISPEKKEILTADLNAAIIIAFTNLNRKLLASFSITSLLGNCGVRYIGRYHYNPYSDNSTKRSINLMLDYCQRNLYSAMLIATCKHTTANNYRFLQDSNFKPVYDFTNPNYPDSKKLRQILVRNLIDE